MTGHCNGNASHSEKRTVSPCLSAFISLRLCLSVCLSLCLSLSVSCLYFIPTVSGSVFLSVSVSLCCHNPPCVTASRCTQSFRLKELGERVREGGGGGGDLIFILTRVIEKLVCFFLHPTLAQTRDYSRSSYTSTHFLSYDTPVHTWKKMKFTHQT